MPNHKTHDTIGYISTLPIAGVSIYFGHSIQDTAILAIGIVASTYYLSPDLDLYSRIYLRWGLLRWIWIPYQKLIHHRSWLSHSGPISATLRLMYLFAWIYPILSFVDIHMTFYIIFWIAVIISDSLHVLADVLLHGD
jgi:uncharacterized metal-binding protein